MIPLRDSTRSCSFPFVTVSLIGLNLYIFLRQSMMSNLLFSNFLREYALVPRLLTENLQDLSLFGLLYPPLITSFFLHGSWFHVIFNMLYLWIFGDNIEDKLGHLRFLLFYLAAGVIGNLAHYLTAPLSLIPLVGASGAVAGILGAYLITFPRARITSLIFIFFFVTIRDIPAVYFLIFWFVLQVINGITALGIMGNTVAWWAHIGGFLAGMALIRILRKNPDCDVY